MTLLWSMSSSTQLIAPALAKGPGEVRVIENGRTDKFRRTLAHVEVDGVDVGEILIGEGWLVPMMAASARGGAIKISATTKPGPEP
jgi:endonuclease YncB( thermonuclease family)